MNVLPIVVKLCVRPNRNILHGMMMFKKIIGLERTNLIQTKARINRSPWGAYPAARVRITTNISFLLPAS